MWALQVFLLKRQTAAAPGMAGRSIHTAGNANAPDAARTGPAARRATAPTMIHHREFRSKEYFEATLKPLQTSIIHTSSPFELDQGLFTD
jgi:hypothetical protein